MLAFRWQLIGSLFVGLLASLLLLEGLAPRMSEIEQKSVPFETHAGMLAVAVRLHRDNPPDILKVQELSQGRVTQAVPGEYRLELWGDGDRLLYMLSFRVTFLTTSGASEPLERIDRVFVVPESKDARLLRLIGPSGSAEWSLK